MFDNKERNRKYGLRLGDIIEHDLWKNTEKAEVYDIFGMDNNSVCIITEDKRIKKVVAEYCKILTKVEDRTDFKELTPLKLIAKRSQYNDNFHIIYRTYYKDWDTDKWKYSDWYYESIEGMPELEAKNELERIKELKREWDIKIVSDKEYWENINFRM